MKQNKRTAEFDPMATAIKIVVVIFILGVFVLVGYLFNLLRLR